LGELLRIITIIATIKVHRAITVLRLNKVCYHFCIKFTMRCFLIALVDMFICTSLVNNSNLLLLVQSYALMIASANQLGSLKYNN